MKQQADQVFIYGALAIAVIALFVSAYAFLGTMHFNDFMEQRTIPDNTNRNIPRANTVTEFDRNKAFELMDSNHDGLCDICGMRIEDCIASGMMQCTMDTSATIGLLGSQHIHADIKVYLKGEQLNLADSKYWVQSKFVHVENDGPGKAGNVVHIHATGIDVGFFLESLGIQTNNLKIYVNDQEQRNGLIYVFKNQDKILVTDSTDERSIGEQIESITDYAPPL